MRRAWSAIAAAIGGRLDFSGVERLDIRWRFRLVVLVFGLPFLVCIVWSATQQAALEKAHAREGARADATLIAARFEDQIDQVDRLLATIAQSIGPRIADVPAISELLQNMRRNVPRSVDNIAVWSVQGDSVTSLDRRSGTRAVNVSDRNYFREAIARRDLAIEGPIHSRSTGVDIVQFARPIHDRHDVLVGVVTMSIRSDQLIRQLDSSAQVGNEASITIVDEAGVIAARSTDGDTWVGRRMPHRDWLADAFATLGGTSEEPGVDGGRQLSGFSRVGKWPWLAIVARPLDDVTGPVAERLMRNLGIGVAIFGVALLVAGRVAARTVTPLARLTIDTERFARGELSHRSRVVTGGEIGTLVSNINRMAAALEQRDIELATSRTQLRAIADNIPEQITYVDRDERYRFVNAYPGPLKNMAPDEMIGRTVREVRGEEVYQLILPALRRAMEGEAHCSERSIEIDGRTSHFAVTYVPDVGSDGEVKGVYAFAQDITERKTADLLRAESEKRLVTITDNVPAMICYVDQNRCFRFANRAFEKWFQRPLADIIGQPFDRMMAPELAAQYSAYFVRALRGEALESELKIVADGDGSRWLQCAFIPDIDEASGRVCGVYGMIHNVTKAKEAEQRLTQLAQFDTLTGLANRHQFNETFARTLAANDRDGEPLALMFLDIDHFKLVNDRHGHGCGDVLLKDFAQRLSECVRPTDAVARLSGDEFVVLLERMHSDDEPQFIARKIVAAVEKPFMVDDHPVRVTTSIGIAMRARTGEPASVLMKRADEALYEAKRSGRNTFRMAS